MYNVLLYDTRIIQWCILFYFAIPGFYSDVCFTHSNDAVECATTKTTVESVVVVSFVVDDDDNDLLDGEQSMKVSVDVQKTSKL